MESQPVSAPLQVSVSRSMTCETATPPGPACTCMRCRRRETPPESSKTSASAPTIHLWRSAAGDAGEGAFAGASWLYTIVDQFQEPVEDVHVVPGAWRCLGMVLNGQDGQLL